MADSLPAVYRIFLRDLVIRLSIGVHEHEHRRPQQVRINVELTVRHPGPGFRDEISAVLSYEELVEGIRRIADLALVDDRVLAAEVRVEKLEVFPDAASVGVAIVKGR